MVGLLSVVLVIVAAFSVDIGQAYVKKRDLQHTVDFAALAGAGVNGANLPGTPAGTCWYGNKASAGDAAIINTAAYLGDEGAWDGATTPADLVDCDLSNGEASYGRFVHDASGVHLMANDDQLSIIAPQRHVRYNLGGAAGVSGVDVSAQSTAEIRSAQIKTLPLYAYNGCDYGGQTIAEPSNGHTANIVLLSHGSETNSATLSSLTTTPSTTPPSVPLNVSDSAADVVTVLSANNSLGPVTAVGFFESGNAVSGPEPVVVPINDPRVISHTSSAISLHLPAAVTSVQDVWYIRVQIGSWSQATHLQGGNMVLDALPLQVGSPTLTCGQGSNEGNFGTLKLTNDNGPNGQWQNIAYNIATGLQEPLGIYPADVLGHRPSDCTTSGSAPLRVLWSAAGTNCVDTKPGLDLDAAQAGFLDGLPGTTGLLRNIASEGCDGTPAATQTLFTESGTAITEPYSINNDNLSCFLTDSSTDIGDIASASYAAGPVLSPAIYNSPRFALVPVIGSQPTDGSCCKYTIVDLRPAFITDQPMSATRSTPTTSHNGITLNDHGQHDIQSVQIVFFNRAALPEPPGDVPLTDWTGSGIKRVVLAD